MTETKSDIENAAAWAEVIEDLLFSVPQEIRADVLTLAVRKEEAECAKRAKSGGLRIISSSDFANSGSFDNWHEVFRLKSLIVQVFVRDVANSHSASDAEKLLFSPHRFGTGSGSLGDYLRDLPRGAS